MGIKHKAVKAHGDKGYASEWNDDHEIDDNVDFEKYEALNLCIHTSADPPAAPSQGQVYYDTDDDQIYFWTGAAWVPLVQNPYADDVDCNKKESKNHVIENRTDMPAGPVTGQIIYRTDEKKLYIYDGAAWAEVGGGAMPDYYPTEAEYQARNATQIFASGNETAGGSTVIYTVPVDKVLFITNGDLSLSSSASGINAWGTLTSSVGVLMRLNNMGQVGNCAAAKAFIMPIKLTAGQTVSVQSTQGNTEASGSIQGWLEDA